MRHSESLRIKIAPTFPFLFGGTFIEAVLTERILRLDKKVFPFLFGGTFIEAREARRAIDVIGAISLPFRRDFH